VVVLPEGEASTHALAKLQTQSWPTGLILVGSDAFGPFLGAGHGITRLVGREYLLRAFNGLRLAVARPESLGHPEAAVALAKEGCDLVALPAGSIPPGLGDILATRCLDRLPTALVSPMEAVLYLPPEGHGPWGEIRRSTPAPLTVRLDVAAYRSRHIFDRLDLETLLDQGAPLAR
jgi:hypothetical protein